MSDILWRVAILLLPWQTRWFHDATLAGWPWEQGRISFYASWISLLFCIYFLYKKNAVIPREVGATRDLPIRPSSEAFYLFGALFLLSLISLFTTGFPFYPHLLAMFQWWIQIFLLSMFVVCLVRTGISSRSVAIMGVISVIPHVVLGWTHYLSQQVIGSKWLGMATHLVATPGTSVIEHDGLRILRAYGGFPHPNIFGAWLVVAFLLTCWLATTSISRRFVIVWSGLSGLLSATLVITYARSAWLAGLIGFMCFMLHAWYTARERKLGPSKQRLIGIFFVPVVCAAAVICFQYPHVAARFRTDLRLEQKSIQVRTGSLQQGLDIFKQVPLFGTGPNAELLALAPVGATVPEPLEPPHSVYLLALVNFGLVGVAVIVWGLRHLLRRQKFIYDVRFSFVITLLTLGLFDHYLWSTWSGQSLVVLVTLFIFAQRR